MTISEIANNTAWNVQYCDLSESAAIIERAIRYALDESCRTAIEAMPLEEQKLYFGRKDGTIWKPPLETDN